MATGKNSTCLELQNISLRLRTQDILRDISLVLREQEIVGIIGPNGAGKTTLFNVICGHIHPNRGRILFQGCDITDWPPHAVCHAGITRTFQSGRPFPYMTALENILIGEWFGKRGSPSAPSAEESANGLLELVGLGTKRDTIAKELTLSEIRRLEFARALATHPQILLLDEIAAGLSPQAIKQTIHLIRQLSEQGLTLLIIDHFLNLTVRVSDRLIALDHGEKIADGKPSEVLDQVEVVHTYLGGRD